MSGFEGVNIFLEDPLHPIAGHDVGSNLDAEMIAERFERFYSQDAKSRSRRLVNTPRRFGPPWR